MLDWLNPFNGSGDGWASYIVSWLWTLLALYLCYKCNTHEMILLRIVYLLIAWIFTPYYLVYYLLYHGLLQRPCANAFGSVGVTW